MGLRVVRGVLQRLVQIFDGEAAEQHPLRVRRLSLQETSRHPPRAVNQGRHNQLLGELLVLLVQPLFERCFGERRDLLEVLERFGVQLQLGGLVERLLALVARSGGTCRRLGGNRLFRRLFRRTLLRHRRVATQPKRGRQRATG